MNVLILNGAGRLRDLADAVEAALSAQLASRDHVITRRDLTALTIPDCKGDFGCWTHTPGVCVQAGPHRDLAREIVQSDLVAWLTPVTFGGYSSTLKRLLDHCIPLISPRFASLHGETHHEPRYERFPSVLAVGLMDAPDPAAARVFERLVRRNVLNMYAPHFASPLLTRDELPWLDDRVARWLDALPASQPPDVAATPLELGAQADLPAVPPRRALLLVGSPRGGASVSAAIATHFSGLLAERGLTVATEWIHRSLHSDPELRSLADALRQADVVALSTPLYVDSLPAPVIRALEILGDETPGPSRPRFLALVNCGFPEAVHTDTALAICRLFATQAGLDWVGGLGIGGGAMLAGRPLAELGSRARHVTRALALAANAISQGRVVPDEAQRLARSLAIPAWLYRFVGDWGFRQEARRQGTLRRLRARPYVA